MAVAVRGRRRRASWSSGSVPSGPSGGSVLVVVVARWIRGGARRLVDAGALGPGALDAVSLAAPAEAGRRGRSVVAGGGRRRGRRGAVGGRRLAGGGRRRRRVAPASWWRRRRSTARSWPLARRHARRWSSSAGVVHGSRAPGAAYTLPATSTASSASRWSLTPGRLTTMFDPDADVGLGDAEVLDSSRMRSRMTSRSSLLTPRPSGARIDGDAALQVEAERRGVAAGRG